MVDIKVQDKATKMYHPNNLGPMVWYDDKGRPIRTYDPGHGNLYYKYVDIGQEFEVKQICSRQEYIDTYCKG